METLEEVQTALDAALERNAALLDTFASVSAERDELREQVVRLESADARASFYRKVVIAASADPKSATVAAVLAQAAKERDDAVNALAKAKAANAAEAAVVDAAVLELTR